MRRHGHKRKSGQSPEYRAWTLIKNRSDNPRTPDYSRYGARGIKICDEWRHDFLAFLAHIGPRPSPQHSVDRIDNSMGYEPGNVRWATRSEQGRNKRTNRLVLHRGRERPLAAWAEEFGLPMRTLWWRLAVAGWSAERALTTPIRPHRQHPKRAA
jgi:hypothetical protein